MTDHPTEPAVPDADPVDELASALLDGAAGDDERRRAGEPEVAARMAAFEAVAARVGEPVPPPPAAARESAIAAAVAAAPAATPGTGDELGARRTRRRRPALPGWAAGAAAALLVLVGLGAAVVALSDGAGDGDSTEAADAPTVLESAEDGGGGAEVPDATAFRELDPTTTGQAAEAPTAAGGTASSELSAADLGAFADDQALVAAARTRAAARAGAADDDAHPATPPGTPCEEALPPDAQVVATATLDGEPVLVAVGPPPAGVVTVYDAGTCTERFSDGR